MVGMATGVTVAVVSAVTVAMTDGSIDGNSNDVNFDFELYTNFPNYTKYIGDLRCLIFLAPSQKNCLKIMFVLESKN